MRRHTAAAQHNAWEGFVSESAPNTGGVRRAGWAELGRARAGVQMGSAMARVDTWITAGMCLRDLCGRLQYCGITWNCRGADAQPTLSDRPTSGQAGRGGPTYGQAGKGGGGAVKALPALEAALGQTLRWVPCDGWRGEDANEEEGGKASTQNGPHLRAVREIDDGQRQHAGGLKYHQRRGGGVLCEVRVGEAHRRDRRQHPC